MTDLLSLPPLTTWQLPGYLAEPAGEKDLRCLRGIYGPKETSRPNNGEIAQFCILAAILDLRENQAEIEEARIGAGGDDTSKTVLRDMPGDAILFTIQKLWPDRERDATGLRREVQFLINHGGKLLKERRFQDLSDQLASCLKGGVEY